MKRILNVVSAEDIRGPHDKLMELLSNEKYGHYWLHQLALMMRKEPTHVLTQEWLDELANKYIWEEAEEHFLKTKQLWFNRPNWPFQICVLNIGGMSNTALSIKWNKFRFDSEKGLKEDIKHFSLPFSEKEKKICLIRLQARTLGFEKNVQLSKINCSHPNLNLSQCPPETAFYMRFLVKEYFDRETTVVASDFFPSNMVDKSKKRVYWFNQDNGYGNKVRMGAWDISDKVEKDQNSWWIFQYNLPS